MADDKPEQTVGDDLEQFENEFTETLTGEPLTEDEPEDADLEVDSGDVEDEPPDDAEAEAPPTESEPEVDTAPEPKLYTMPDDEKFGELRGKQATAAQLEEAGLLDTVVSWGHAGVGAQKKLSEIEPDIQSWREYQAKLKAEEEARQSQPEPQAPLTKEQIQEKSAAIEAHFRPLYEKAAENGAIEPEFLEFAPKFLTGLEYRLQAGQQQISLLTEAVVAFAEDYSGRAEAATVKTGGDYLYGIMDEVAKVDGLEAIGMEPVREKFVEWFGTEANGRGYDKMETSMVTQGLMEDAFFAFLRSNPNAIGAPSESTETGTPGNPGRKLATGGGSSRGATGGSKPGGTSELDVFERELEEANERRY